MNDTTIKIIYWQLGWFIAKIQELPGREIGEPDCLLIDPCVWNENQIDHHHHEGDEDHNHDAIPKFLIARFPGKLASPDTRMAISSSNILSIMDPSPALLSEYLVAISD